MAGDSTLFTSLVIMCVLLIWLTFVSCGVSLFSPAWMTQMVTFSQTGPRGRGVVVSEGKFHVGLIVYCSTLDVEEANVLQDCTWFKETGEEIPGWMAATRALIGGATCIYLLAAACSSILFFRPLRNPECSSLLVAATLLGCGATVVGVVLFGMGANRDSHLEMSRQQSLYFDWGYYIAIIAAGLSVCALVMTVVVISLITRTGQKSHTQVSPSRKA